MGKPNYDTNNGERGNLFTLHFLLWIVKASKIGNQTRLMPVLLKVAAINMTVCILRINALLQYISYYSLPINGDDTARFTLFDSDFVPRTSNIVKTAFSNGAFLNSPEVLLYFIQLL